MGVSPGVKTDFFEWPEMDFCADLHAYTAALLDSDSSVNSISYGWQARPPPRPRPDLAPLSPRCLAPISPRSRPDLAPISWCGQGDLKQLNCKAADINVTDVNWAKLAAKGTSVLISSGDSGSGYTPVHAEGGAEKFKLYAHYDPSATPLPPP